MNAAILPDEPLAKSATLGYELAAEHCQQDTNNKSCAWYHGAWQYLRLLGVISGIVAETTFFQEQLRGQITSGNKHRILIVGTADYGMLAQIYLAYKTAGIKPTISIVDRCLTPLRLNEWYAARVGLEIKTYHSDILNFVIDDEFDVICTHSFFSFINPLSYAELALKLYKLLSDGGRLVTTQSIRPDHKSRKIAYTSSEIIEYGKKIRKAAELYGNVPAMTVSKLEAIAVKFASNKTGYVIRDVCEVSDALTSAGFQMEVMKKAEETTSALHQSANPDDNTAWQRYQICARKTV